MSRAFTHKDIFVWHIDLLQAVPADVSASLSSQERDRAGRFATPALQQRYVMAHAALRQILAGYLRVQAEHITFIQDAHGKPHLGRQWAEMMPLQFNLSHSRDRAVVSVCLNDGIGVDIEAIEREIDSLAIALRYFSISEYRALLACPEDLRHQRFIELWTCKEAFVKGIGRGIGYELASFSVSLEADCESRLIIHEESPSWQVQAIPAPRGYLAALAHQISGAKIHYQDWIVPR